MRTLILAASLAGLALPAAPAFADPPSWAPAHGKRAKNVYNSRGQYIQPRALSRNDRVWRGRDGRYYCRRDNGTTGLVIGAALGGLLGNQVAGSGDRTLGTIIGAVGGGLLGREVDRGDVRCR
ncbi:MAG: glycine zipper 2TM domain-containing protein [Novosphingobium sp.]|nr:glycine zipper 2TM domain-containing protein [Novosphingobium sp.]